VKWKGTSLDEGAYKTRFISQTKEGLKQIWALGSTGLIIPFGAPLLGVLAAQD
jgi:hypothetical protein